MIPAVIAPLTIEIHPGEHPEGHLFGLTFNLDTIWMTVLAGAIVIGLGTLGALALTRTPGVPNSIQLGLGDDRRRGDTQVEANMRQGASVRGAAGGLAVLLRPDGELARAHPHRAQPVTAAPPTADVNFTYAMASW